MNRIIDYILLTIEVRALPLNVDAAWKTVSMERYRGIDENGVCRRCQGKPCDPMLGACPNCKEEDHGHNHRKNRQWLEGRRPNDLVGVNQSDTSNLPAHFLTGTANVQAD